jgi:probable HAF family extracellular repeat protein
MKQRPSSGLGYARRLPRCECVSLGRPFYTTIDPPGSLSTTVTDINAKGEVVGYYQDATNGSITSQHGFLYSGGLIPLGPLDPSPTALMIKDR